MALTTWHTRRTLRIAAAIAAAAAATVLTTGAAPHPTTTPDGPADADSARSVASLIGGAATTFPPEFPPGFTAEAGYVPAVEDGIAVAPGGGCSSPVPLPAEFETPCKAHDLGYDLLRYAASTGHPLGPQARDDIDEALRSRLLDSCADRDGVVSAVQCVTMAQIAGAAVSVNTWRQNDGVPIDESPAPYLIVGGAAITLVAAWRVRSIR